MYFFFIYDIMKKKLNMKKILLNTLAILFVSSISAQEMDTTRDIANFTHEGFPHRPNLITFEAASSYCNDQLRNTDDGLPDYYERCVRSFYPFLIGANSASSGCSGSTITWNGSCRAILPSGNNGQSIELEHDRSYGRFIGKATYQCTAGNWIRVSSECLQIPENCKPENNSNITWPVTYPEWARTGGIREKAECQSSLNVEMTPFSVIRLKPNSSEYNFNDSSYDMLCIDGSLSRQGIEGRVNTCNYIPKSCSGYQHNFNNCNFNVPNTEHDYNLSDPSAPGKNINISFDGDTHHGDLAIQCFDSEWLNPNPTCNLNPVCGANIDFGYCVIGSSNNSSYDDTNSFWQCSNGRMTKQCSKEKLIGTDGVCGSENETCGFGSVFDSMITSGSIDYTCSEGELFDTDKCRVVTNPISGLVWQQYSTGIQENHGCIGGNTYPEPLAGVSCSTEGSVTAPFCYGDVPPCGAGGCALTDGYFECVSTGMGTTCPIDYSFNSINNNCEKIIPANLVDNRTYSWKCSGSESTFTQKAGSYAACNTNDDFETDKDPICGSANNGTFETSPSSNLCNLGFESTVNSGTNWTWTCSNGGKSVNCSANKAAAGGVWSNSVKIYTTPTYFDSWCPGQIFVHLGQQGYSLWGEATGTCSNIGEERLHGRIIHYAGGSCRGGGFKQICQ